MRNERTFQGEFPRSVKMYEERQDSICFYWKLRDDGQYQPFDAILLHNGYAVAFEYKMNKAKQTINMARLFSDREHQIHSLKRWKEAGGDSWVVINWFVTRQINRCFAISPENAQEYIDKGTVKMEEFVKDRGVYELPRKKNDLKQPYWNLDVIL